MDLFDPQEPAAVEHVALAERADLLVVAPATAHALARAALGLDRTILCGTVLGATAGLGGTLLAAVLAWIVLRFVLDTPWTLEPGTLLLGVLLTTAGSLAVGLLATVRLLGRAPLSVLRQE